MVDHLFVKEQAFCYAVLVLMTIIGCFTDKIPIAVNVTVHSVLIIGIGSFKSLEEMLRQMKKIHIDKKFDDSDIEKMSMSDAIQFPIFAGCTLCGLYFGMKYFGKDVVNIFILSYIAVGGTTGVKALITSFVGNKFDHIDKDYLVDFSLKKLDLIVQITQFDIYCFFVSAAMMYAYYVSKNWIFNNILATMFCIHALQTGFISTFKNGFALLVLLFFYDIFFVFGTDVMLTVAKGIEGPIKL